MKKIILLISLVSLLFISCENSLSKIENPSLAEKSTNTPAVTTRPSEDGKTYITFGDISFENESRTINPVYNRDDLTALYIKGMETTKVTPTTKPNDYTTLFGLYNPKATSYEDLYTKTFEITPGVWNFILYATLYDFDFSGMTTVEVKPGMTHALNFTLATTNTSSYPYGIIDITVDFTGNADRVVATLKEKSTSTTARITKTYTPTDTKNPISTVEGETYKRINFKTANSSSSSSGGVTAGKYYLLFEFFQDGFDEPINTVENIVRVENNFTTKKTLNLDLDELYTITYSYWEGSGEFYESELENLTFTPASTVLPSVYSQKSETFILPTPSLPGYTFDAWYKATNFTEENKITQITQGSTGNLELYANFVAQGQGGSGNSFFVDTDGDDENSGLDAEHPLKTIMTAISKMNNSNTDYVINVMGDLFQANFSEEYKLELTEDINGKAKSITFKGNADSGTYSLDGQSGGDPTTVMKVTTSVPIILEGIKVTGGCANSSHLGGAIYIGEESTVILGQGTIVNGGGSHGCGSAIYVAASDNGGVTKAGSLIIKDNAVVNSDEFGEIYLCTGATIKVASALTGQSSVWDSNSGEYIPSSIVAKITPQVYAENTPVIALTNDAPATLNISDVYEKFAVFEEENSTSWLITNVGKLSISSVTLKTGTAINTIFQKLGGQENPVITDNGTATSDTTITAFAKSTTAPSSAEFYLDENSIIPVWLDGTTIKYYKPEGCTLYLNSDSSYMFCQLKNITSIDTTDLNTSNVTNMYCLFNSCEKLSTVDLSSFDTSKVTNMAGMFGNCTALSSVDLSSFNTQNVTTMCNMFVSCKGLTVLDLSSFDTRSLENTAGLVGHMTNLTKIYVDPDNWNMTKVTESTSMFWECQNLVGGQGTTCSNSASGVEYARIDGGSGAPGYLTDIADKPAATNDFTTFTGGEISAEGIYGNGEGQDVGGKYTISNIAVCNHLVTQSEYETYMTYFGAENSGDYPGNTISDITSAYYVSWVDAIVYCNLRSLAEGLTPVYTMNGSYDMRTDSNPWTQNYHIAKNASGKYFYDYYEEDTNWDLDQLNLETNFSANGYRLPTSWEYAYIVQSNPNFIDTEGLFEWAHNFFYDYSRVFFDPSSKKVDNSGKNINSREENLGFRVVRNAVSNSGSNP